jgi:tetratricopeptide (TPR) repeat protein
VYEKLSDIHESLGDYKASIKYCKTGLRMTQGTEAAYTFKANIAWLYTRLNQYVRAQKECDDILNKKKQMNQQVLGDTYVTLGVLNMHQGNFRKADFYYKKSLKIREAMGDKKRIAACYLDLGINYQQKFNIKLSEKYYTRALSIYKEIGYQESILLTYNNMGTLFSDYDLARAEEYYLKALTQAKLIGARMAVAFLYINLASINSNRLMDYQAQQNYSRALEIAKEIGLHEAVIISNLGLSELHRRKGNVKKGKRHLAIAYRLAKRYDVKYRIIECQQEEMEYLLLAQKVRRADLLAKRIFMQLRKEQSIEHKVYSFTYRARIFVELKKFAQAHAYYSKAYNYVKALPSNKIAGEILYLRGVAYKKERRLKEALKMFLRANQIFEAIGNLRYLDKIEQEITHGEE